MLPLLLILIICPYSLLSSSNLSTSSPWLLSSSSLPSGRLMASLGNGQLALVPASSTITINCLYRCDTMHHHTVHGRTWTH